MSPIPASAMVQDEGGLWELGVAFPIDNINLERFEEYTSLATDVEAGAGIINVKELPRTINKNSLVFIGPSSNPLRDGSGDFLYFKEYEVFRVDNVYVSSGGITPVYIKALSDSDPSVLSYSYLKGDPVTFRETARDWLAFNSIEWPTMLRADPVARASITRSREDSLDGYKGYSQSVYHEGLLLSDFEDGLIQRMGGNRRAFLNRVGGKPARMSSWFKLAMRQDELAVGDVIDENIAGPQGDDIDEGLGAINPEVFGDPIEETSIAETGTMIPYVRSIFYDDPSFSNIVLNTVEAGSETTRGTRGLFLSKLVTIPEGALSAKFAAYALFKANPRLDQMQAFIDDALIEHCIGTTQEANGYYQTDVNPSVGSLRVSNRNRIQTFTDIRGVKEAISMGDPNTRLSIETDWGNRPSFFVDDMKKLEQWNREGYAIVLRTKMPGILPYTMICNMKVKETTSDQTSLSITFEEVAT